MTDAHQQWSGPAEPAAVGRLLRAVAEFAAGGGVSGLLSIGTAVSGGTEPCMAFALRERAA